MPEAEWLPAVRCEKERVLSSTRPSESFEIELRPEKSTFQDHVVALFALKAHAAGKMIMMINWALAL